MRLRVHPARSALSGSIRAPGDKSISHRAVLFGGLADGTTEIRGFLEGEDTRATLAAVAALGAVVERDGGTLRIHGGRCERPTRRWISATPAPESGCWPVRWPVTPTCTMHDHADRRCVAVAAADGPHHRAARTHGRSHRKHRRPRAAGASPAAPAADRDRAVHRQRPGQVGDSPGRPECRRPDPGGVAGTVAGSHRAPAFRPSASPVRVNGLSVEVDGPVRLRGGRLTVPGDLSSATFPLAAALLVPGSAIRLNGVGREPTRDGVLRILERMAPGSVERQSGGSDDGAGDEPVADLAARHVGRPRGISVPGRVGAAGDRRIPDVDGAGGRGRRRNRDSRRRGVAREGVGPDRRDDRTAPPIGGVSLEERPDGARIAGGARSAVAGSTPVVIIGSR